MNAGATLQECADAYGRTQHCIRDLWKKYHQTGTTKDKPRSGRPPILSLHQKKTIYRKVYAQPKIEYKALAEVGVLVNSDGTPTKPPSHSTLYRYPKGQGLTKSPSKKRPELNRARVLRRLKFCREYQHFSWARRTLKFSDECSVEKGSGQDKGRVFRFLWEQWKPTMLQTDDISQKPAQMVWASEWLDKCGRPSVEEPTGQYGARF